VAESHDREAGIPPSSATGPERPGALRREREPELHPPRTLVVACGALTRELRAVLGQIPGARDRCTVTYLPAHLHNRPERIPAAVEHAVADAAGDYDRIVVAYADCGTGGLLDAVVARLGATRLPGAHCYEMFAGSDAFAALSAAEPGTFYLTDYLARHFDALVVGGLGLDDHPELRDTYFAHYRRLVLLTQSDDPGLVTLGERAAARLGLAFVHRHVGLAPFADAMRGVVG
jgi:hypothetical protein